MYTVIELFFTLKTELVNLEPCGLLQRASPEVFGSQYSLALKKYPDIKDTAGDILYYLCCLQIPRKDQKHQSVSPSLDILQYPQPVCGSQPQIQSFLLKTLFKTK